MLIFERTHWLTQHCFNKSSRPFWNSLKIVNYSIFVFGYLNYICFPNLPLFHDFELRVWQLNEIQLTFNYKLSLLFIGFSIIKKV